VRPVRTAVAGTVLAALVLAGCGQTQPSAAPSPTPSSAPAAGSFPVTVEAANGKVVIAGRPERIISLSPTSTEILFAVGAGSQVVAADELSNYPPEAPKSELSGFKPNVEAIIAKKPDLVVASDDKVVAELTKLNVPVLVESAAVKVEDTYDQITDLGAATGNLAKAEEVASGIKSELDRLAAAAPKDRKLTYFHELDQTPFSATSNTFVGQIYAMFGLTNIADKAPDAASGYPKLSPEYVAQADPDLIFLADVKCCQQSKDTLAKRPGWKNLKAIRDDQVVELDDDIASRWGPRIVDLAKSIGAAVDKVAAK
jgi:iron complex transport system substrate-binding protein